MTLGTSGDPAQEATSLLVQAPSSKRAAADTGPGLSIADRQCDERTKKIWDEIDVNKDNSLNRQELLDYAERKFFPKHFVDAFIQEAGAPPPCLLPPMSLHTCVRSITLCEGGGCGGWHHRLAD